MPQEISFSLIVSLASGFLVLGTFFNAWYSLRERVVKLEAETDSHKKENAEQKTLLQNIAKETTDLKNEVVKLQTILTK